VLRSNVILTIFVTKHSFHRQQTPPRYWTVARPITAKRDVIHKTTKYITYHNAARGGTNHGHRESAHKIFLTIGAVTLEICSRADRHTDRQTDTHRQTYRNMSLPYRDGVIISDGRQRGLK